MGNFIEKFNEKDPERQSFVLEVLLQNLIAAKQWDRIARMLGNLEFLYLKGQRYGPVSILQDYDLAKSTITNESVSYQDSAYRAKQIIEDYSNAFSQEFRTFQHKPFLIPQQIYNNLIVNSETESVKQFLEDFAKREEYLDGYSWFRRAKVPAANTTPKRLRMTLQAHQGSISMVAFSSDKSLIASCGVDGMINIWNYREGRKTAGWLAHDKGVTSMQWITNLEGKAYIVSCGRDENIKVWDLETTQSLSSWHPHRGQVRDVAFAANSQLLITCGDDRCLRVWSLDGKERQTIKEHQSRIYKVAVGKTGKLLMSGGEDHAVFLWESSTYTVKKVFYGHTGAIRSIALTPQEDFAVVGGDDQIARLLDLDSGREVAAFRGHDRRITCLVICYSAKSVTSLTENKRRSDLFIASGSEDGKIILWDGRLGTQIEAIAAHANGVTSLAVDLDANLIISGGNDGFIRIWNASSTENPLREDHSIPGSINCLLKHIGPDKETLILSGSANNLIHVYAHENGISIKHILRGHLGPVSAMTSLEDNSIASGGQDGNIIVWDVLKNHIQYKLDTSSSERSQKFLYPSRREIQRTGITHLAYLGNNLLLSVGQDQKVRFWDLALRKEQRPSQEIAGAVESIVVIPAFDKVAVAGTAEEIMLYDIFGTTLPTSLSGHRGGITCLQAIDETRLISGGRDGTVRLWNLYTGGQERCLMHGAWINCISSNGGWIASGARDGMVKLWNLLSNECITTLEGHEGQIRGVSMHEGNIYTFGDDNTVRVWEITSGKLVAEIPFDSVLECMLVVSSGRIGVGTKQGEFILLQLEGLQHRQS